MIFFTPPPENKVLSLACLAHIVVYIVDVQAMVRKSWCTEKITHTVIENKIILVNQFRFDNGPSFADVIPALNLYKLTHAESDSLPI